MSFSLLKLKDIQKKESIWWVPLCNRKCCVIFPLLTTQDSDLFKMALLELINFVAKPNFKVRQEEKSVSWIKDLFKKPSIFKTSHTSMISDINLLVSQLNLYLT